MLKYLHLLFVSLVFVSFTGRIILAELKPAMQPKWLNIVPHIIDSLLLLSGLALVVQGQWLSADFGWLAAKLLIVITYIGLGMLAMRKQGRSRKLAAGAAIACFLLIVQIAISKKIFAFF